MKDTRVLVVDDEEMLLEQIIEYFEDADYKVTTFSKPTQALEELCHGFYDLVVADYKMPEINGLDLLIRAKQQNSYGFGILFTAYADKDLLERMINQNLVSRYVEKPLNLSILKSNIEELLDLYTREKTRKKKLKNLEAEIESMKNRLLRHGINLIGIHGGLKDSFQKAADIAPLNVNVLLLGESGTGKGELAKVIHALSPRWEQPFIKVNCGAIPETLMESILFGHEKGIFSGAHIARVGKIESADRGTLFLDEIGEMKPELQVKLLHVIEDKQVERLGSSTPKDVDFRLICASNMDLDLAVKEKRFREDLFFRINTVTINIPALRERKEDLLPLFEFFMKKYCDEYNLNLPYTGDDVIQKLSEFSWPGNIRCLNNTVFQTLLHNRGKTVITAEDIHYAASGILADGETKQNMGMALDTLRDALLQRSIDLKTIESGLLDRLVIFCGSVPEAVQRTGISKNKFYRNREE
ncbi:MAG: sigma-54-dependent Fis family transcriptional regulator [Spirochaetales bacterium]|nr:sigma-54-dependent Fis family transcriptional regulator [Spirochaetales bacterium]